MTAQTAFTVADLPQNRPTRFNLHPAAPDLSAIAADMDLSALRKVSFVGQIESRGRRDWILTATFGATVVQPCVVTLEPVTTRLDTKVSRVFLANLPEPDLGEVEMHEDENIELLGAVIDPWAVMVETLTLMLPQYPRADGANLKESNFSEPGTAPMTDEDARPFAGLAGLRQAIEDDN